MSHSVLSGLMGLCVGDALGVPVEFTSRAERSQAPVTTMQGYGTWNQPPGTWSDDSSLTFCLAESLCNGFSLEDMADRFCRWYQESYWTARHETFDVGDTTAKALQQLQQGVSPLQSGGRSPQSNGNGGLMRILPMAFCYPQLEHFGLLERVHQVSGITHAHPRSQIACGFYVTVAIALIQGSIHGSDIATAVQSATKEIIWVYQQPPYEAELDHFERLWSGAEAIATLPIEAIHSSGYVIHTLEAALWCLLTSNSYAEAVLKAVNLGDDTDTTAAVTGGLAGIYYGFEQIPADWVEQIARKQDVMDLCDRLQSSLQVD